MVNSDVTSADLSNGVRAGNEIPEEAEFFGDRVGSLNLCKGVKKNSNSVKGSSLVGP